MNATMEDNICALSVSMSIVLGLCIVFYITSFNCSEKIDTIFKSISNRTFIDIVIG